MVKASARRAQTRDAAEEGLQKTRAHEREQGDQKKRHSGHDPCRQLRLSRLDPQRSREVKLSLNRFTRRLEHGRDAPTARMLNIQSDRDEPQLGHALDLLENGQGLAGG